MFNNGGNATDPFSVTGTGWTKVCPAVGVAYLWGCLYYRAGCGASETAPVFAAAGGGTSASVLAEFSGVADRSPADSYGSAINRTGTTQTVTNAASDTGPVT